MESVTPNATPGRNNVSLYTNALGKGMNPSVISPAMGN